MDDIVKVVGKNKNAVIILVAGSVVIALYLGARVADVAEGAAGAVTDVIADLRRKIISGGVIAAVILVGSFLLGAPAWLAFAATGLYLSTSAVGKAFGALAAGETGTGIGSPGGRELADLLCASHNGVQSELTAGGITIIGCRDGQSFQLKG